MGSARKGRSFTHTVFVEKKSKKNKKPAAYVATAEAGHQLGADVSGSSNCGQPAAAGERAFAYSAAEVLSWKHARTRSAVFNDGLNGLDLFYDYGDCAYLIIWYPSALREQEIIV